MLDENKLITSLSKYVDKETLKTILLESAFDGNDLTDIYAFSESGLLDLIFELCDIDFIMNCIKTGELDIYNYRQTHGSLNKIPIFIDKLKTINDSNSIAAIFSSVLSWDINDVTCEEVPLAIDWIDEDIVEFLGGYDTIIYMLDTYGSLHGWYKNQEFTDKNTKYYRTEEAIEEYYIDITQEDSLTIQILCDEVFTRVTHKELQQFLQDKFNQEYDIETDFLSCTTLTAIGLEFDNFYKL